MVLVLYFDGIKRSDEAFCNLRLQSCYPRPDPSSLLTGSHTYAGWLPCNPEGGRVFPRWWCDLICVLWRSLMVRSGYYRWWANIQSRRFPMDADAMLLNLSPSQSRCRRWSSCPGRCGTIKTRFISSNMTHSTTTKSSSSHGTRPEVASAKMCPSGWLLSSLWPGLGQLCANTNNYKSDKPVAAAQSHHQLLHTHWVRVRLLNLYFDNGGSFDGWRWRTIAWMPLPVGARFMSFYEWRSLAGSSREVYWLHIELRFTARVVKHGLFVK